MEAYPMPLFVKLEVGNMEKSINWYKKVLGFGSVFELSDNEGKVVMAHIRGEQYQDLMLVTTSSKDKGKGAGIAINFTVNELSLFTQKAITEKADVIEGPIDRPWNARELIIKDPDGYCITLSMNLDSKKDFHTILEQIKD
ncbi:VOC family protein [Metabacillus malikii]|uniref:Glyoxalase superfamily protein PhnB n=1 Tax=Metabacillus malikii TaxID=1504265 RepID=A0ABT9ZMF4_9BACI|nr:VOC family protein [Metabacillus malikii]MDQ0232698.1 putative glyoxalase superfamily protein PhnB [Metabacillus malikii]